MTIQIKKTTDVDAAYAIAKDLPDFFNEEGYRNMQKDFEKDTIYGAYEDDKMVGFVSYKKLNSQALELSWLGVFKEYQGKGVGTKLVTESLEDMGAEFEVCMVKTLSEVDPDEGYKRTRGFYKKLGFIPLETIDPYPGMSEGNPIQIFVKLLLKLSSSN